MRTLHISIIIVSVTSIGLGLLFFNLWQVESGDIEPPSLKIVPQRERIIQDLTESVMSAKTYDDKLDAIQKAISQTNLGEFSEIVITNLKSDYADGEKVKFDLTVFGYYNWCLFPNLSLYHEKYGEPIWESGIAGHCPPPAETASPRVSYWKSADFNQFPSCRYEGTHTIMGESFKFGPKIVGRYYCHGLKEFQPPKTIQMSIPFGASDPNQKINFEPVEINADWGDYINFTNNDFTTHSIVVKSERTDNVEFYDMLGSGKSSQMKILNNKTKWVFSETIENKRFNWMKGIIHVN